MDKDGDFAMKKVLAFLILAALAFALVTTNPNKESFVSWTKGRLAGGAQDPLSQIGASLAAPALGAATTARNYLVCTVYETNVLGKKEITLGILGIFIKLK